MVVEFRLNIKSLLLFQVHHTILPRTVEGKVTALSFCKLNGTFFSILVLLLGK